MSLGVLLIPALASAQSGPPGLSEPPPAPAASAQPAQRSLANANVAKPAFGMLDNTGDGSELQLELATSFVTGSGGGELLHPRVLGQYISPGGLGGYASLSATGTTGDGASDSQFGLGNLELGGLYQRALDANVDLGMRAGLVFHTSGGDTGLLQALGAAISRPADIAVGAPATWLRLGISPTLHDGMFFARADFGVDVMLDPDAGHPLGHVNVGIGVGQQRWSASAEFGIAFSLSDSSAGSFKVAGVAARYQGKAASPFVMVSLPLEDEDLNNIVTLLAGVTLPI